MYESTQMCNTWTWPIKQDVEKTIMKAATQWKLENILLDSFQQMSSDKVPINWHISCDKASQIAETKNTVGCKNLNSEMLKFTCLEQSLSTVEAKDLSTENDPGD